MNFDAPIPGESLTKPEKNMPFERPPEISDPEEAIQMHLTRLSSPEMQTDILDMLELDVDVVTMTEGILRSAVATGVHSIDISLSIAPVIHEFIKTTADDAGINYDEGLEDKKAIQKRKEVSKAKAEKMIQEFRKKGSEPEPVVEEDIEEEITVEEPEGFIKRRM